MRVCQPQRRQLWESLREWLSVLPFTCAFLKSLSSHGLSAIAELLVMSLSPLKNGAGGILYLGLSVCEWVSVWVCVPKTLWTPYLKNQWREFRPILLIDVFGFVDMLISWLAFGSIGQRSRSQQAIPNNLRNTISQKTLKGFSINFGAGRVVWVCGADQPFGIKGWRWRSQQVDDIISPILLKAILLNSGHMCICIHKYAD